jgi:hypothetical protein
MQSLDRLSANLEKLDEMGEQESHEDVSFEEQGTPTMLILIFGIVIIAAVTMAIIFIVTGNSTVYDLLGNHPQRT